MCVTMPKLTDNGLVLHDLDALAIPVAFGEVTFILETVKLVDLNSMALSLAIFPQSSVLCPIVAPMMAETMSSSAFHRADIVRVVLASASVGHLAN